MRIAIFFCLILTIGCQPNSETVATVNYFDLPKFTSEILHNISDREVGVEKKFTLNSATETKTFESTDSLFWSNELEILLNTDFNAPKYKGLLTISKGQRDSSSNLLVDIISANTMDSGLQGFEVYYLDDLSQIRKINLRLRSKNFISSSNLSFTAWFNQYGEVLLLDSMMTEGKNKVLFQEERVYSSNLNRIRK